MLLSLSLLADASSNLLPLRNQENNEADDSLILQDSSELIPILRLPSEKENEMITEVPQLVRRPWDGDQLPKVTDDRFSVAPRLREKESDSISQPTEREGESISPLRETERERYSIFLRGGRKGWRFRHPWTGCHHHHGGEMKFGHRRGYGNHFRFRPQFPRSSSFPSYGDHGKEAVSSFRSFSEESSLPGAEKEVMATDVPHKQEVFTVGDFMTRKEYLFVVKPTTMVDEALETLVANRITGLPVVDDDWKLVGVVSDYDLLALDSISGAGRTETGFFPQVGSTWKAFNELQKLLNKTNGKIVAEVMTPSPLVVREYTNLEDAARLLLETKYRRLPVVDNSGKLVGLLTRGNVIKAALQMKHAA